MKKLFLSLIIASAFSAPAMAEKLKGGMPACESEELFEQIGTAIANHDDKGYQYLLSNGCIIAKPGIQISVLDKSWTGTAKVRAYVGNTAVVLWTYVENVIK